MEFREEWALPSQRLRLQFRVLQFQLCSTATEHDANSSYYCFSSTSYEGLCIFQQEGATWSGEFAGCSRFPSRVRAVRTSAAGWV